MTKKTNNFWEEEPLFQNKIPTTIKIKIGFYFIFGSLFFYLFLFIFDSYFFIKNNEKSFKIVKKTFEIFGENIKNKNLSEIKEEILYLEASLQTVSLKISKKENLISNLDKKTLNVLNSTQNILKIFAENSNLQKNFLNGNLKKINLEKTFLDLEKLLTNIKKINAEISFYNTFLKNKKIQKLEKIEKILEKFLENKKIALEILGVSGPKTSVFLFQNSNEKRPTGGFIGSYLIISANNGFIKNFEIKDIYDFDGQITENLFPPFEAKTLIGKHSWSLRDTNINPNLEISSKYFDSLYQKAGGESIDNFFYLESDILKEILSKIGDIYYKNETLTPENFDFLISFFVERQKNISKKPEILSKIFKKILQKMKNPDNILKILDLKKYFLQNGKIKIYSKSGKIEKILKNNGFFFKEKEEEFKPYFISISSNKSDKFVKNTFGNKKINDSEILFRVKRKMSIPKDFEKLFKYFYGKFGSEIPKADLKKILIGGENNSILQIYTEKKDLLFYRKDKFTEKKYDFKTWKNGKKDVFEIKLDLLKDGKEDIYNFYFKEM